MLSFVKRVFFRPAPKSQYPGYIEAALMVLAGLEPYDFARSQSSDLSNFKLIVVMPPIQKYTRFLEKAIMALTEESVLYRHDCNFEPRLCFLSEFFLTEQGTYLDEVAVAAHFFQCAKTFLTTYGEVACQFDISVTHQHNQRVLGPLVQNLIQILERFRELRHSQ